MKKETENWLKIARNDLRVAETLFKEGLCLNVIEHGHAALEKLIKGVLVEQNKNPPKIHNLLKLVSLTLIENVQNDIKNTLEELDDLYFSTRYPQDFDYISQLLPKERVVNILRSIKEIYKLLEKNIK